MFGIATARHVGRSGSGAKRCGGRQNVDDRLTAPFTAGANDFISPWETSRDHDVPAALEKIAVSALAIIAADHERSPPEIGLMDAAMKWIKQAKLLMTLSRVVAGLTGQPGKHANDH